MELIDIAWVAGLVEGEGSMSFSSCNSPRIQVAMTDYDVIEKLAGIWGGKIHERPRRPEWKRIWVTGVYGKNAVGWLYTLYTFMGKRRRAKILEIITKVNSMPVNWKRRDRICPRCEQRKISTTKTGGRLGYCRECYNAIARERYHCAQAI